MLECLSNCHRTLPPGTCPILARYHQILHSDWSPQQLPCTVVMLEWKQVLDQENPKDSGVFALHFWFCLFPLLPLSTGRKVDSESPDAPCCLTLCSCQGFALLNVSLGLISPASGADISLILGYTFLDFRVTFYNTCTLLKASTLTTRVIRKSKWHHTDSLPLSCRPSEGIVGFLPAWYPKYL